MRLFKFYVKQLYQTNNKTQGLLVMAPHLRLLNCKLAIERLCGFADRLRCVTQISNIGLNPLVDDE